LKSRGQRFCSSVFNSGNAAAGVTVG